MISKAQTIFELKMKCLFSFSYTTFTIVSRVTLSLYIACEFSLAYFY